MWPEVSIIVPFRNEEQRIERCLDSILNSSYPLTDCEVLLVDGNSTDSSRSIVLKKLTEFPCAQLLHNARAHVPAGLNQAIRIARGRFILRMDAHCEYQSDYIDRCLRELEWSGAGNVGGLIQTLPGQNTCIARCIALISQQRLGVGNSAFRLGKGGRFVDTVPFGAFRREVFDVVGLYREDLPRNQDFELNARIRAGGYKLYLSDQIRTKYYNSRSGMEFFRQAVSNGRCAALCWKINPKSFCLRHAAPGGLVITAVSLACGSMFSHLVTILTIACMLLYGIGLSCAGVAISKNSTLRHAILAPFIIAGYHLCYGTSTAIEGFKIILDRKCLSSPSN